MLGVGVAGLGGSRRVRGFRRMQQQVHARVCGEVIDFLGLAYSLVLAIEFKIGGAGGGKPLAVPPIVIK